MCVARELASQVCKVRGFEAVTTSSVLGVDRMLIYYIYIAYRINFSNNCMMRCDVV